MATATQDDRFGDARPLMVQLVTYAGGNLRLVNRAVVEAQKPDGSIHLADVVNRIDALTGRGADARTAKAG